MSTGGMHGRVVVEAIAWRDVLASWLVHRGLSLASRKTRREISARLAAEGFGQTSGEHLTMGQQVMRAARERDRPPGLPPLAPSPVVTRGDLGEGPPVVRYPGRGGE